MLVILKGVLRWTLWLVLSFAIVVAVLALAQGLPERVSEWKREATAVQSTANTLKAADASFKSRAEEAVREADREIDRLRRASAAELDLAEGQITDRQRKANGRILDGGGIAWAAAHGRSEEILASYRAQYVELPLLVRAADLIKLRKANLRKIADDQRVRANLRSDIGIHNEKVNRYNRRLQERNEWQREADAQLRDPVCEQIAVPILCSKLRRIEERNVELAAELKAIQASASKIDGRKAAIRALNLQRETVEDGARIARDASVALTRETRKLASEAESMAWNSTQSALHRHGWHAFLLVLGGVLLPVFHKLFTFSVIARLAGRAGPLRLREAGPPSHATLSATAVKVPIDRDTELLLRSGVQDRATDVRADDIWLLKKQMPLTCIAAGLVNLQRFRSDRPDFISVTASDDGHHEVALVTVPAGGAIVLQPSALVGVVKRRSEDLIIRRPWRLRWLISWVTFQFRYVIFEGPCSLIVQGNRGVNASEPQAGRATNKRLILGFDAGLKYSAARSASFRPYLFGQASLFDDRFEGNGIYLYEARASGAAKGSIWGRGIKGIGDALMSALGV